MTEMIMIVIVAVLVLAVLYIQFRTTGRIESMEEEIAGNERWAVDAFHKLKKQAAEDILNTSDAVDQLRTECKCMCGSENKTDCFTNCPARPMSKLSGIVEVVEEDDKRVALENEIINYVEYTREEFGTTYAELAEELGYTYETLHKVLNRNPKVSMKTLEAMSNTL